jgi:hypothetical protein
MKMRKSISLIVLAVYSIVMAHSFIPHHHHSELAEDPQICEYAEYDVHHEHQHELTGDCCVNQEQEHSSHQACSFNEKTILVKSLTLSNLHLSSTIIEFIGFEKTIQSLADGYIPIQIPDKHCRDIKLRGPPQFS